MPTANLERVRLSVLRAKRAVLATVAACLLTVWCHDAEAPGRKSRSPSVEVECPAVVDVRQDAAYTGMAGRSIPPKPEEWQQREPCRTERDEVALGGACYVELARKPPCKAGQFEAQGRCWAAVARQKRPSTSVDKALGD